MTKGFKMTRRIMDAEPIAKWRKVEMYNENVRSDDEIRTILRNRSDTVYHPVGTALGTDEGAVVDLYLRVVGVEGLRVVDASIMPPLIGGNTNAPSIMIGEKAAEQRRRLWTLLVRLLAPGVPNKLILHRRNQSLAVLAWTLVFVEG